MDLYLDASVVLRILGGEPSPLAAWERAERPISSDLLRVECLRAIDRARVQGLSDVLVAERRAAALETLSSIDVIPISTTVLDRASDPFPTSIGTLDAIHLASAVLARAQIPGLVLATHDEQLGLAARAMGFEVLGLA